MTNDVCLICMPYSSVTTPSLALSLIENYIKAFEHSVSTTYANLMFAKKIDIRNYEKINNAFNEHLIGEWTFSQSAFPEFDRNDDDFFSLFVDLDASLKQTLLEIRSKANEFIDELANEIINKSPKIVGCTSTFQQNCASLALLRKIKQLNPSIVTLMGGANCEGIMGQTISDEFPWVDYVFSGECDEVIGSFIDSIIRGREPHYKDLPTGFITQKNKNLLNNVGSIIAPPRAYVESMDKVTAPNFVSYFDNLESLKLSEYISPALIAETSRGCWWGAKSHCTFCGLNGGGMTHRSKSAETAISELEELASTYNNNKFLIVDNILPVDYMKTVLPALAEQTDLNIFYETKANLKKHHVEKIANAGIKWIQPGIEGLHDDFLKIIKKGTTAIQNLAALKWCRAYGIRVTWNLLCDAPFEKEEWYEEIAEWLPKVTHFYPPHDQMVKICYHRFSPYFDRAQDFSLDLEPMKSYQYVYPLSKEKLSNIAYFFLDKSDNSNGAFNFNFTFNTTNPKKLKVQELLGSWNKAWEGSIPMLFMADHGDSIIIMDTRKVATNFTHTLEGLSATIYRLCSEPIPHDRLIEKIIALNIEIDSNIISVANITKTIEYLIDNMLLIHLSKCYMALAFPVEESDMIDEKHSPAGRVNLEKLTE